MTDTEDIRDDRDTADDGDTSGTSPVAALTTAEAARAAGVSARTIRRWIEKGALPAVAGAGGVLYVFPRDLEAARVATHSRPVSVKRDAGDTSRTGTVPVAGDAGDVRDASWSLAPDPAGTAAGAILEAWRDTVLAPVVEHLAVVTRDLGDARQSLGRIEAERDALAADRDRLAAEVARDRGLADQLVDLLQEERDALRRERNRFAARVRLGAGDRRDLAEAVAERDDLLTEVERLWSGPDAPQDAPAATGAAEDPDPAFHPSVAAWRERTTRAVDVDRPAAPAPWWRFWGRRR